MAVRRKTKKVSRRKTPRTNNRLYLHVGLFLLATIAVTYSLTTSLVQQSQAALLSVENDGDIYDSTYDTDSINTLKQKGDALILERTSLIDNRVQQIDATSKQSNNQVTSYGYMSIAKSTLKYNKTQLLLLKASIDRSNDANDIRRQIHSIFTDYRIKKFLLPRSDIIIQFGNLELPIAPAKAKQKNLNDRIFAGYFKYHYFSEDVWRDFLRRYGSLISSPLGKEKDLVLNDKDQLLAKINDINKYKARDYNTPDGAKDIEQKFYDLNMILQASSDKMDAFVTKYIPTVLAEEDKLDTDLKKYEPK